MRHLLKLSFFSLLALLSISSCDKDDPDVVDPPELITTVNVTLTPSIGGAAVNLSFQDLDGDGGDDPIVSGGTLSANTNYVGTIDLLNESVSPTESITEEIEEEDEDHQFFFNSDIADINILYNDQDDNSQPVGLSFIMDTGAEATGNMTITLRHEPNKSGEGVAAGEIANAGGETDIEVTFPIDVE